MVQSKSILLPCLICFLNPSFIFYFTSIIINLFSTNLYNVMSLWHIYKMTKHDLDFFVLICNLVVRCNFFLTKLHSSTINSGQWVNSMYYNFLSCSEIYFERMGKCFCPNKFCSLLKKCCQNIQGNEKSMFFSYVCNTL